MANSPPIAYLITPRTFGTWLHGDARGSHHRRRSEYGAAPIGPSTRWHAVSGQAPPAGPQFQRKVAPLLGSPLAYDKPLCASLDGFTLHAATRAGGLAARSREALVRYVLRPPLAQNAVQNGPEGMVRIVLNRPFPDGTQAVDMDPLSLLCRLAAAVPPPRFHTVKYAGVPAPASKLRPRIVPKPKEQADGPSKGEKKQGPRYWRWAERLRRTFGYDVLTCPKCNDLMTLIAMVSERNCHRPACWRMTVTSTEPVGRSDPKSIERFLKKAGEPTEAPPRTAPRRPPYWKSIVLRRSTLGDAA